MPQVHPAAQTNCRTACAVAKAGTISLDTHKSV